MKELTLITTIDLKRRSIQILVRLYRFLKLSKEAEIKIVIGHANRNSLFDFFLKKMCTFFSNVKLVSQECSSNSICNSLLRNIAAKKVFTKYILLCDVDIHLDKHLFQYMLNEVQKKAFCMVPVLYLSKKGTFYFLRNHNIEEMISLWWKWELKYFLHIAIPSSLICLKTKDFFEIGGFDENFSGHGYEDFDFMTRLAINKDQLELTNIFFIDKIYRAPLFSQGFRQILSKYCLENVIKDKIGIHLFHKKKHQENYYKYREKNRNYFFSKLEKNIKIIFENDIKISFLVDMFYEICTRLNKDPMKYTILFNDCPRWKIIKNKEIEK